MNTVQELNKLKREWYSPLIYKVKELFKFIKKK